MKNNTILGVTLLLYLSITTISCKKKPKEGPATQSNCDTKYEVLFGDAVSTNEPVTIAYENGQIKNFNSSSFILDYEYAGDKVNISFAGKPLYIIEVSNNLATKVIDVKTTFEQRMSYDGNRNLVKIDYYFDNSLTDTKILTYANGNLNTLTQTFNDNSGSKRVTTYSYSTDIAGKTDNDNRHLLFGVADQFIPMQLLGNTSKNILTKTVYTNTSENFRSDITKTYTYSKSPNGSTNKIVEDSYTLTVSNGKETQNENFKRTIVINTSCN